MECGEHKHESVSIHLRIVIILNSFDEAPKPVGLYSHEQNGKHQSKQQRTTKLRLSFDLHMIPADMQKPTANQKKDRPKSKGCGQLQAFCLGWRSQRAGQSNGQAGTDYGLHNRRQKKSASHHALIFSPPS